MAGNILFGGLIGAAVDAGSGAMYDLKPNPVEVTLMPLPAGGEDQTEPPNEITAKTSLSVKLIELNELLEQGLLSENEYNAARKKALDEN